MMRSQLSTSSSQEEAVAHLQPRDGGGARAHRHLDRPVGAGWHGQAPLLERHMPLESLKRVEHAQRGPGRAAPRLSPQP